MKYKIEKENFLDIKAEVGVVFVIDKNLEHKWVCDAKKLEKLGFQAGDGEVCLTQKSKLLYVGVNSLDSDDIRVASSNAIKAIKNTKFKSLKIALYLDECPALAVRSIVEGFELGIYKFEKYLSKKDKINLKEIIFSTEEYNDKNISQTTIENNINKALIITNATNLARDIVNTPPQDYTSLSFEKDALEISEKLENVTCKVYDEEFLKKENMNAFLAVNKASPIPPRLIHLTYKPKNSIKRVIYVGKGLTYDTGGLSLKPSSSMVSMKADKSGAAAALAIIKAAAELKLPFEIHSILGATENAIGGDAYKPDDILIARNKKSIEVKNTDAEGRLVLADCLSYAQDFKPDLLIDMATLTGACVVALGEYTTGVIGFNHDLINDFENRVKYSGELTNPLRFNKYLKTLVKSNIADTCNISSSRYGGAITAGVFLSNFIEEENKQNWLHLDIAGPAFTDNAWGYNPAGGSGAGVRMNLYYLMNLAKEAK